MSDELSDFFKLISADKQKKKEEFNEMVGDLGLDSLFEDIAAEKRKVKEEKEKEIAQKIEEQQKEKEEFDQLLGDMSLDSLFGDLSKAKKEVKEDKEKEKKVLASFENFLNKKIDDIEEIKEELVEEVELEEEEIEEEVVEEEVVEEEKGLIEKSLGLLSEPSQDLGIDKNFATLDDLQNHYREFLVKIQQQLSTLGGGGIEDAPKTGGPYVRQGQKWVVSSGGIGTQFADNQKLNFGDNDDLQIQHTSTGTGIIQNAGSGQLQLRSNQIRLLNAATTEDYAFFNNNGSVDLYHDNVKRFETTGYGVTVSGISSATNVSIANTFRYPPYIIGGQVPRAVKSQGGYGRSSAFDEYQTGTEASQDPADYVEYTQELANTGTWRRFGITTAGNQARDGNWWGETNPNYDQSRGLFGGLTNPAGVDNFFDFSENTAFNNAQTSGSLKYTQALGSFSLKECNVGDLVLARFDLNIMPMVTNTTVEVALIYANRDASDNITFTFPLTITPFTYGSGTVGRGYLLRPTITAYIANDQDINSRSLLAIKADNPVLVNPIGVLFTIQR